MSKVRVAVRLVARQTVHIEIDVEEVDRDDACDLTGAEIQRAIDEADRWAWSGECRVEGVEVSS